MKHFYDWDNFLRSLQLLILKWNVAASKEGKMDRKKEQRRTIFKRPGSMATDIHSWLFLSTHTHTHTHTHTPACRHCFHINTPAQSHLIILGLSSMNFAQTYTPPPT